MFGEFIRELRTSKNITKEDFAKAIGLKDVKGVDVIEENKLEIDSFSHLLEPMANYFEVDLHVIYDQYYKCLISERFATLGMYYNRIVDKRVKDEVLDNLKL